jgi:hypothetical protein
MQIILTCYTCRVVFGSLFWTIVKTLGTVTSGTFCTGFIG